MKNRSLLLARSSLLTLAAALLVCGLSVGWYVQPPAMYAHFIDAGQADCTLLEFPCGAILIDAGAQDEAHVQRVLSYLDAFFQRRTDLNKTLESIILTHSHIDHTKVLRPIVERFTVKRYIDSGLRTGSGRHAPLWLAEEIQQNRRDIVLREIHDHNVTAVHNRSGLTDEDIDPLSCSVCDPMIHILSGQVLSNPGWTEGAFTNENNQSLVIRVDFGDSSFLFTGDMEEPAIETLVDWYTGTSTLDVDVYHVGHHGSLNGTTDSLLRAMTPQSAVISMGRWNFGRLPNGEAKGYTTYAYGHPRIEILNMLSKSISGRRSAPISVKAGLGKARFQNYIVRKRIYATGWDGNIKMRCTLGGDFRVTNSTQ